MVIVAGVVANFVFAFLLLMVMAMTVGVREPGTVTSTVEEVTPCVPAAMTSDCGGGRPPSPAARAGLRAGDRVVSFGGTPVSDWDGLTRAIDDAKPGETVQVAVRRPGAARPVTLPITLADVDGRPFVGMSAKVVGAGYERTGPLNAAVFAGRGIGRTLAGIGEVVVDLPGGRAEAVHARAGEHAGRPGRQRGRRHRRVRADLLLRQLRA
ncbi:PDZ domain-containing protein [Actinomadura madurae]|uniref:PDZ domain-containing protein n=1 Tax=Actinomadura madurae TaxID=1993 RepID=UPI0020D242D1|nr:M50 family metallopeptidase [Actinomadura madurae]MCP9971198.1 PDZ domain-containing protein [Actinomadura madurae]